MGLGKAHTSFATLFRRTETLRQPSHAQLSVCLCCALLGRDTLADVTKLKTT